MTSSSHYPQSNGLAERTVKTVKKLISNTDHPLLSLLLSYRATPLPWCGLSPAKLLMGRCIRTGKRSISLLIGLISMISELSEGTPVWISTQGNQSLDTVSQQLESPRSYTVDTSTGHVRRNRRHLRCRSENTTTEHETPETVKNQSNRGSTESKDTGVIQTRSRTRTVVHSQIDSQTREKNGRCGIMYSVTVLW